MADSELFELLTTHTSSDRSFSLKLLKYDPETRVIVLSNGEFHFYAFLSKTTDDSDLFSIQPQWIEIDGIQFTPKDSGSTQRIFYVITVNIKSLESTETDDSHVLSQPWNGIGAMEVAVHKKEIPAIVTNLISNGATSKLELILKWSDEARLLLFSMAPIFDDTYSCFHAAAYYGQFQSLIILCQYWDIQANIMQNENLLTTSSHHKAKSSPFKQLMKVDALSRNGHSALYLACQRGCLDCVRFLVGLGADPCFVAPTGYTPLSISVECNQLEVARFLWTECGVGKDGCGNNPASSPLAITPLLHFIVSSNRLEMLRVALEAKEVYDGAVRAVFDINERRELDGATPLFMACNLMPNSFRINLGGLFPSAHVSLTTQDSDPLSEELALKTVHQCHQLESARTALATYLLAKGADPDASLVSGHRPLYLACQAGSFSLVCLLLQSGAVDMNHEVADNAVATGVGWRAIDIATKSDYFHIVQHLLGFTHHLVKAASATRRSLELAVFNNSVEVATLLLQNNPKLIDEITPASLAMSIVLQNHAMVKLLLRYGADPDQRTEFYHDFAIQDNPTYAHFPSWAQNGRGLSLLHIAVLFSGLGAGPEGLVTYEANTGVIQCLLRAGCDLNQFSASGQRTALMAAIEVRNIAAVELLLSKGCDTLLQSSVDGMTALASACCSRCPHTVNLLLDHTLEGIDQPVQGITPVLLAANLGLFDIVRTLLLAGASYYVQPEGMASPTSLHDIAAAISGHSTLTAWLCEYEKFYSLNQRNGLSYDQRQQEEHFCQSRGDHGGKHALPVRTKVPLIHTLSLPSFEVLSRLRNTHSCGSNINDKKQLKGFVGTERAQFASTNCFMEFVQLQNLRRQDPAAFCEKLSLCEARMCLKYEAVALASSSLRLALSAASPWSVSSHKLWSHPKQDKVSFLLFIAKYIGDGVMGGDQISEVFISLVIPFVLSRDDR